MDIGAISAFVAAAEKRSFTTAGKQLGITASGVSKAITRLENELRLRLLNRSTRTMSLTPDGTAFYARCKQILLDLSEAKQSMLHSQEEPRGQLRVSVPVAFGRACVIPIVAAFMDRYPEVDLQINVTDRFVGIIEEGFDAVVRIGDLPDSRMIARALTSTQFVVCGSPRYFKQHSVPRRPEDLRDHQCVRFISPETHQMMNWTFFESGKRLIVAPKGRLSLDHGETLVEAALCHMGLIYIQDYIVRDAIARNLLRKVLTDYAMSPQPISVVYPHNRHFSARTRIFVEFLIKHLRRGTSKKSE